MQKQIFIANRTNIAKLLIPFLLSVILIISFYLICNWNTFYFLILSMFLYFVPFIGREGMIPIAIANEVHPFLISFTLAFVEIMVALFLLWNFDYAKLIPIIGKFIEKCEEKGEKLLKEKQYLRSFAFLGVISLAGVPIHGSGATISTIVGRIIGLSALKTFFGVIIGAIFGNLILAYFSDFIISFAKIYFESLSIVMLIVIIVIIIYIWRRKE